MQASSNSELKLKIISFDDYSTYQVKQKLKNSKFVFDTQFYQKLFLIILTLFSFLIIPESPQDSENLCFKYHTPKVCKVW